ncbi:baseplate J/gp47 family protein [Pseudomonas arsenicoxydans]|uniref:Uncharacterized protein n=1 Tax=Pseudomonas arsenicoxydans TaxID=702115 RepID=A0A502HRM3_9PSED|nr:baseplate J/gp47 family protein [Pseudomonas arsenicoxydans]TPG76304.1 hypothetical protein EAH78_18245 [Pseudomonas arsenicoxydans]
MAITYPTFEQYVQIGVGELREQLPDIDPTIFGSWANGFIKGAAALSYSLQMSIRDLELQAFPQTATGEHLEMWAGYELLTPKPAAHASGRISVPGTVGDIIAVGTIYGDYETQQACAVEKNILYIVSFTRSGTTATVEFPADHALATSMTITVTGADQAEYNGNHSVVVIDARKVSFMVLGAPPPLATGPISVTSIYANAPVIAQKTGAEFNLPGGAAVGEGFAQFGGIGGGADIESSDELRERTILSRSILEGVFTEDQIKLAALSVPAVTRVFVIRPESHTGSGTPGVPGFMPAPGQVAVYVLTDDSPPPLPSQSVLDDVKTAVITKGRLPAQSVEADVFTLAPALLPVNFQFSQIVPDSSTMRTAINEHLKAFFEDEVVFQQGVSVLAYSGAIQNTVDGVTGKKLETFTLASPRGDIVALPGQMAVVGSVNFP